jgi:membrane protein
VQPTWRALPYLLQRTLIAAIDDGCFVISKGAAYSALLSFFPVLTSVATILVMTRAGFVWKTLSDALQKVLPPGTEQLVLAQFRARGQKSITLLFVALLLALWAASGVIKSLLEGFHSAYRTPIGRSFVRETGVAIGMVFLAAIPMLGASVLVLFGNEVDRAVSAFLKPDPFLNPLAGVWHFISVIGRYLVALASTVALTCLLYFYGPNRRQNWGGVWRGAVLATMLWLLATKGFASYVRHIAHYNVMYGSIGASIALLVWMYVMAAIAILGCEFNAEFERLSVAK